MKNIFPPYWKEILFHPVALLSIFFCSLIPFFMVFLHFYSENEKLQVLSQRIESLSRKAASSEGHQKKEEKILSQMKKADPFYLDKYVESLVFLEAETQKWQMLADDSAQKTAIRQRLAFLQSGKNALTFAEGDLHKNEVFQEVEEKQKYPVEVNEEDLKKLLCAIEGVRIHPYYPQECRPQLVIKSFDLTKKTHVETKEKVFIVNMQLIKRENKQD